MGRPPHLGVPHVVLKRLVAPQCALGGMARLDAAHLGHLRKRRRTSAEAAMGLILSLAHLCQLSLADSRTSELQCEMHRAVAATRRL